MNKKALLVQERYGGILISLTYVETKKHDTISQINYIVPQKRKNGEFINDDIKDILVGKNNFLLSNADEKSLESYIKILGEEPRIEFSKMSKANSSQIDFLYKIVENYKTDINLKKEEYSQIMKKIYEFSHSGNIYMFDKEVDSLSKKGLKININVLADLRAKCYAGR